ncbi:MAG: outer membrane protein assembly factor BamE [Planctomycetaceae bacterium]|nr:outer membrane protein assembly factor BamE [Planctomycetaceae bacterium]
MDSRSSYAVRLLLVIVATIVAWQCVVYAIGPVIPRARLGKIKEGMSKEEVVRILGEPAVRGPEYVYEKPFNPGYVQVTFDPGGRVRYVNDESVFR